MIKPLILANKTFPNNIIQGPLAGISCAPFRALVSEYGRPAFTCTEMLSSKTLQHASKQLLHRFVSKAEGEGPVCFQLSGNNANDIAEATKRVADYGADLVDLNCGCPVNKIRRKGAGSALLSEATKLRQIIDAMKANTSLPVSVKIRVDGASSEQFNRELCTMLNESAVDFVIVHGRHWTEHYETPCRYDQITFFVNELKIPVIGNGDIKCLQSLKAMYETGCAGVMIARAGVGQPWLAAKLQAEYQNQPFKLPDESQIKAIFFRHVVELTRLLHNEKRALLQARKFAKYYARQLNDNTQFVEHINQCTSLSQLETLLLH